MAAVVVGERCEGGRVRLRRGGGVREAAVALASAQMWCDTYAPVFGGPPGESTADWMDRLVEFGLAARASFFPCAEHEWTPWARARWRRDRVRRDCLSCGVMEMRRLVGPFGDAA